MEQYKFQLSYSSAGVLQACPRKYYYEKIARVEPDSDVPEDTYPLRFGSALHLVLEMSEHKKSNFSDDLLTKVLNEFGLMERPESRHTLLACLMSYYQLHEKSCLTCHATEYKIDEDKFIGYVDLILVDSLMNWWISDIKTSSKVEPSLFSRLHSDPQLNLYSYFIDNIAKGLNLDHKKFMGCKYRVIQKPKNVVKAGETPMKYWSRIEPSVYEVTVASDKLNPGEAYRQHLALHSGVCNSYESQNESVFFRNRSSCLDYYKPCKFWSRCHLATYTGSLSLVQVASNKTMTNQDLSNVFNQL